MPQIRMLDNLSPSQRDPARSTTVIAKTGQQTFESIANAEAFYDTLVAAGRDPIMCGGCGAYRVFW